VNERGEIVILIVVIVLLLGAVALVYESRCDPHVQKCLDQRK